MPMYRAVPVDAEGRICGPEQAFIAKTDFDAIAHAMTFAESEAVEVWDQERRIGLIQSHAAEGDGH
jgi:hypothetical protein